jgi:hypothetical protein
VSGDGIDDLVVGAPRAGRDAPSDGAGRAYVVLGPLAGGTHRDLRVAPAELEVLGDEPDDATGQAVTIADVTGDSQDDVLVAAYAAGTGSRQACGKVHVFAGPLAPRGLVDLRSTNSDATLIGARTWDGSGWPLATADVNQDGYQDLLMGSHGPGMVGLVRGPLGLGERDLLTDPPDLIVRRSERNAHFGHAIAVGDVIQDGIPDLAAGAHHSAGPLGDRHDAGVVQVVSGIRMNCAADGEAPSVDIASPHAASDSVAGALEGSYTARDMPIPIGFEANDDDTWIGEVVHEQVVLDDAVLFDGNEVGDRDGLLADESLVLTETALCESHRGQFGTHRVGVIATDCGGKTTRRDVDFEIVLDLIPGAFRVKPESFNVNGGQATAFLTMAIEGDACRVAPAIADIDVDSLAWVALPSGIAVPPRVVADGERRLVLKVVRLAFGDDCGASFAIVGRLRTGERFIGFDDVRRAGRSRSTSRRSCN